MALPDLLRAAAGESATAADYEALAAAIRAAPDQARALLDDDIESTVGLVLSGRRSPARASWLTAMEAALSAESQRVAKECFDFVSGMFMRNGAGELMAVLERAGHRKRLEESVRKAVREGVQGELDRDPFEETDPWGNPTTTPDLIAYCVRSYIDELPEAFREVARDAARQFPDIDHKV